MSSHSLDSSKHRVAVLNDLLLLSNPRIIPLNAAAEHFRSTGNLLSPETFDSVSPSLLPLACSLSPLPRLFFKDYFCVRTHLPGNGQLGFYRPFLQRSLLRRFLGRLLQSSLDTLASAPGWPRSHNRLGRYDLLLCFLGAGEYDELDGDTRLAR